jgi:hypothetical protein
MIDWRRASLPDERGTRRRNGDVSERREKVCVRSARGDERKKSVSRPVRARLTFTFFDLRQIGNIESAFGQVIVERALDVETVAFKKGATALRIPVVCRRHSIDSSPYMTTKIDNKFTSDANRALPKTMLE